MFPTESIITKFKSLVMEYYQMIILTTTDTYFPLMERLLIVYLIMKGIITVAIIIYYL